MSVPRSGGDWTLRAAVAPRSAAGNHADQGGEQEDSANDRKPALPGGISHGRACLGISPLLPFGDGAHICVRTQASVSDPARASVVMAINAPSRAAVDSPRAQRDQYSPTRATIAPATPMAINPLCGHHAADDGEHNAS